MSNENSLPDIFLHLPRSAGTTLWTIINHCYGYQTVNRVITGTIPGTTEVVNDLIANEDLAYRLIGGHFNFDADLAARHDHRYFTMLRQPADRAISTYYKIIRREQHKLHDSFTADEVSLEESFERMPRNLQTRMLAAVPDDRAVTEADLAAAKANLEKHFAVVGVTEQFDESLMLLKRAFGWPMPYYRVRNSSANRPRTLPDSVYERAEAANLYDVQLYAHALTRFDAQVTAQGTDFERELHEFRVKSVRRVRWAQVRRKLRIDRVAAVLRRGEG